MQTHTQAVNGNKFLQGFGGDIKKSQHAKPTKQKTSFSSMLEAERKGRKTVDVKFAKKAESSNKKDYAFKEEPNVPSKKVFLSQKNDGASQKSAQKMSVSKETAASDADEKLSKKMLSSMNLEQSERAHTDKIINAEASITLVFNAEPLMNSTEASVDLEAVPLSADISVDALSYTNTDDVSLQTAVSPSEDVFSKQSALLGDGGKSESALFERERALSLADFENQPLSFATEEGVKENVAFTSLPQADFLQEGARSLLPQEESLSEEDALFAGEAILQQDTALLPSEQNVQELKGERKETDKAIAGTTKSNGQQKEAKEAIFTIIDQRTPEEKALSKTETELSKSNAVRGGASGALETSLPETLALENSTFLSAEQNILSSNNQSAGATGSTFQEMLNQQIQANAENLVKAGSIVLKDSNSGSINLVMKPESLGNVKISMELSDKVIAGHIVVHSKEALEAFRQNLDTLKHAFEQNGFDNAHFTLSLADSSLSNGGAFAQSEQQSSQLFAEKAYSPFVPAKESSLAESGETVGNSYSKSGDYQIDVVA